MKTIIATLIISALSALSMDANARDFYKNVEVDNSGNTVTTYVYEGSKAENAVYLTPYKKYIIKKAENGESLVKVIYDWDNVENEWKESVKYDYYYGYSGELSYLSYAKWDDNVNTWDANIQYTMYTQSPDGILLTINE